jgi:Fe(3+) dicitrate transport protein
LFNSFNSLGGKIGNKFSYYTYYNYKTGDGYRDFSGFDAHNFYGYVEYKVAEQTTLSAEMSYFTYLSQQAGGLTDAQFIANPRMSTRERNWFEVDWKLYIMQLQHQFADQSDFSLSLFALDAERNTVGFRGDPTKLNENPITALDEQDVAGNYILPRDIIRGNFNNWGAEARILKTYKLKSSKAVFLVGAKYYHAENTSLQGPGSTGADADFKIFTSSFPDYANQSTFEFPNRNFSLFGEHIFYLTEKLSLTPGFRLENIKTESIGDYNRVVFDNAGNPISNIRLDDTRSLSRRFMLLGIGASYKSKELTEIYANVSQNYRSVTFSDIRVVNPTFIIDPNISDERGVTMDIGIRGRWKKNISFDMGIYSVLYKDRIGIILDDRANRVRKNIGNAFIAGVENYIEINLDRMITANRNYKWSWFVNSAYTYSEYLSSEDNNVVGKKLEFIPQANIKTGIKLGYKNLMFSTQYSYLSSQFTDVQNSKTPDDGDIRSGIIGEIPDYKVVDMSLSFQRKWYSVETGVNNLLDEAYFTRRATGYPGPGIIPSDGRSFYITLGIKL